MRDSTGVSFDQLYAPPKSGYWSVCYGGDVQNEHALNLPYFCYMGSKRKGNHAGVTKIGFPKHHMRLKSDRDSLLL